MTKPFTDKILNAFGHGSTRLLIIDTIAKNGNSIHDEDLIEKVGTTTKLQRESIRRQLKRMELKGEITWENEKVSLLNPVEVISQPLGTWPVIGIPIGIIFLIISFLFEINPTFQLASIIFILYAFAVNIREIIRYLKKTRF